MILTKKFCSEVSASPCSQIEELTRRVKLSGTAVELESFAYGSRCRGVDVARLVERPAGCGARRWPSGLQDYITPTRADRLYLRGSLLAGSGARGVFLSRAQPLSLCAEAADRQDCALRSCRRPAGEKSGPACARGGDICTGGVRRERLRPASTRPNVRRANNNDKTHSDLGGGRDRRHRGCLSRPLGPRRYFRGRCGRACAGNQAWWYSTSPGRMDSFTSVPGGAFTPTSSPAFGRTSILQ